MQGEGRAVTTPGEAPPLALSGLPAVSTPASGRRKKASPPPMTLRARHL